jgi:hypothetical protein
MTHRFNRVDLMTRVNGPKTIEMHEFSCRDPLLGFLVCKALMHVVNEI